MKPYKVDHLPSDVKDVADWLGAKPEDVEFNTGLESIDLFKQQIVEMESTYLEFPEDEMRTKAIERLLNSGEPPLPIYVGSGDKHNFIMEGRHRIVAFHRFGLAEVPVCRVHPKEIMSGIHKAPICTLDMSQVATINDRFVVFQKDVSEPEPSPDINVGGSKGTHSQGSQALVQP